MSNVTEQNRMCNRALAVIDDLERTADGWSLPPKTANGGKPARSTKSAGWGWTHYFLLGDGTIMGDKLPDNMTFICRWADTEYGWTDVFHLGRAVPRPDTDEFVFEAWPFPIA